MARAPYAIQKLLDNRPLYLACFIFPIKVSREFVLCLFINYPCIYTWIRRNLKEATKKIYIGKTKCTRAKRGLFAGLMYLQMNEPVQLWPAKSFLSRFVLRFLKPAFHLYQVKIKLWGFLHDRATQSGKHYLEPKRSIRVKPPSP